MIVDLGYRYLTYLTSPHTSVQSTSMFPVFYLFVLRHLGTKTYLSYVIWAFTALNIGWRIMRKCFENTLTTNVSISGIASLGLR